MNYHPSTLQRKEYDHQQKLISFLLNKLILQQIKLRSTIEKAKDVLNSHETFESL